MKVKIEVVFEPEDGIDGEVSFVRNDVVTLEDWAYLLEMALQGSGYPYVNRVGIVSKTGRETWSGF